MGKEDRKHPLREDSSKKRRAAFGWAAALAGGVCLWALFTWPVPRLFASGIPSSHRTEDVRVDRVLVPGDHLQLLYHFWLARDMIAGGTPAFANVYEFNTDSTDPAEEVRRVRRIDPFYAPFSLVYAAISPWAGDAAGWNSAALLSVLLGVAGLFALARRYTASSTSAFLATLVATAFPYRWITLLAGSPTGFAMGLAPFVPLGLDIAVRDRRMLGGWLAGVALLLCYCSDLHVYYFSALSAPLWCLFSWLCRHGGDASHEAREAPAGLAAFLRSLLPALRALLPAIGLALLTVVAGAWMNRQFAGTDMSGGRTWNEVMLYSAKAANLFVQGGKGMGSHLFLTVSLGALLALCLGCALAYPRDLRANCLAPRTNPYVLVALLFVAMAGVVCLALGSNGPAGGLAMKLARAVVPKYTMIRQAVKIYCLMPALIAVALALLLPRRRQHPGVFLVALLLSVLMVQEAKSGIRPALSLLPREQAAYRAIAEDAAKRGVVPHALCLPLWPGDSHWSSLNLHGAMNTRVRLVNGYNPARRDEYVETVFRFYESANEGFLSDEQLDRLLASGVDYIVLHEDAFPEKVSPWPASVTLRRLFENRRLVPMPYAAGGRAWTFRIAGHPSPEGADRTLWTPTVLSASPGCRKKSPDDPPPLPDESGRYVFAAADLFHAGETVPEDGSVRLDPDRDPVGAIVYGPHRAVRPGRYHVELDFAVDASVPAGERVGELRVRMAEGDVLASEPVVSGRRCVTPAATLDDAPLRLEFLYGCPVREGALRPVAPVVLRTFSLVPAD
jgi:hypothetical protein